MSRIKALSCLLFCLLIALPQAGLTSDKTEELLYLKGIEIVEMANSDFQTSKTKYLQAHDEEMAKVEALKAEINRLQLNRAKASNKLDSMQE